MNKSVISFLIITTLIWSSSSVLAHPGRTDAYGGHTCYTNCSKWGLNYGEYHYHNPTVISTPTPSKKQNEISKPFINKTSNLSQTTTPKNIVLKVGTFTIGSSKERVKKVMGVPTSANSFSYSYGYSNVYFSNGVVSGYYTIDVPLKVFMGYKSGAASPFTIGSTRSQVIAAMGTPDSANDFSYSYGYSSVFFTNGKVSSYSTIDIKLNVK